MRLRMVGEAGDEMAGVRPTGHLQVKGGAAKRRYYALWRDADGRHQQLLGPAYVKDSRRRTPRGAIIWRSGDGPKPDPSFLTPPEAAAALRELLAVAPKLPTPAGERTAGPVTFGDACREWLRYVEHYKRRALRWGDVDFAKRLVHVRRSYTRGQPGPPKSGKVRSVPLIDQAAVPLDGLSRREHFTGDDDLVFATAIGRPLNARSQRRQRRSSWLWIAW